MNVPFTSVERIRDLVWYASRNGIPLSDLCEAVSLSYETVRSGSGIVNLPQIIALYQLIESHTDSNWTIRYAQSPFINATLYSDLMLNCPDVKTCLKLSLEMSGELGTINTIESSIMEDQSLTVFTVADEWEDLDPITASREKELLLMTGVSTLKQSMAIPFIPTSVTLTRPTPDNPTPFIDLLGESIIFGADRCSITSSLSYFDEPFVCADRDKYNYTLEKIQQKQQNSTTKAEQTKQIIRELLKTHLPDLQSVAYELKISPRTLQRDLKDESITFKELLDSTRSEIAQRYLTNPSLSINEIAYLLGYTDPSNFARAFKKWTSHSPREWRNNQLS